MGLSSFKFVQYAPKNASLLDQSMRFGRSRSSKVDDFGTNCIGLRLPISRSLWL